MIAEHPEGWLLREFTANIEGLPIVVNVGDSPSVAARLKGFQFDMIFIDADHAYESVKADILAWCSLLAPGGILCGHDYYGDWPGVRQAVDELIQNFRIVGESIRTTEL
jgi:predicted O-methyltransferase YrrM